MRVAWASGQEPPAIIPANLKPGVGVDAVLLMKAAVMGVVEGLTEFLPVSSTGHLILTGSLLGMTDDKSKVFDIAIQTGAILAVIIVYWQRLSGAVLGMGSSAQARRFVMNIIIGFLPAALIGFLLLFGCPSIAIVFESIANKSTSRSISSSFKIAFKQNLIAASLSL